jgi:glycosyltransferase involved in cell wall biosynthesis
MVKSDMASPKLSILLLCWNHARFLKECIGSIARQTRQDFEIVFLDNVSTDGSFELAAQLFDRFGLTARMIRNEQPQSIPANANRLLAASSGGIVAPLSTDDWYDEAYVETMLAAAGENPDASWFSCSGWLFFDAEGRTEPFDETRIVADRPVSEVILAGGEPHFFVGCAYRRSALDAIGGWDENQLIEDRDLFLRLAQRFKHHRIAGRLVHYRRAGTTASANAKLMLEGWDRFFTKHAALFGTQLTSQWAECMRTNAALLIDQGHLRAASKVLLKALTLKPLKLSTWRTLGYLGRAGLSRPLTRHFGGGSSQL